MLAIATVTAALLALSATAEAATIKYDRHGRYRDSYKHEDHDSYEPSYESHYAEQRYYAEDDYREPHQDSYDEDHYDGNAYSEEPSYAYEPSRKSSLAKRYKRSVKDKMGVREDQVLVPFGGKIGKKLGKILKNPVLKKVSKKVKRSANREVSPGCFSSPPKDCGADCVASFRKDKDCYQCCCMESPVNATTCVLPADGGDCRGNLKRWAFNEATGDCEPFTYGGCGGNGNRFMCKEMCKRQCVKNKGEARQSVSRFGCCRRLEVRSAPTWPADLGFRNLQPEFYTEYNLETGLINERDHWVSNDGTRAIWMSDLRNWGMGDYTDVGSNRDVSYAYVPNGRAPGATCPENIGFGNWRYYAWCTNEWHEAAQGLKVFCLF